MGRKSMQSSYYELQFYNEDNLIPYFGQIEVIFPQKKIHSKSKYVNLLLDWQIRNQRLQFTYIIHYYVTLTFSLLSALFLIA